MDKQIKVRICRPDKILNLYSEVMGVGLGKKLCKVSTCDQGGILQVL